MVTSETFLNDCPFEIFDQKRVTIGKKIGEGGNANVYQSEYREKEYAVKIYNLKAWGGSLSDFDKVVELTLENGSEYGDSIFASRAMIKIK